MNYIEEDELIYDANDFLSHVDSSELDIMKICLEKNPWIKREEYEVSAIGRAIWFSQVIALNFLIRNGFDVNVRMSYEQTPIMWCFYDVSELNFKIFNLLIKSGANINDQDIEGDTALHFAARYTTLRELKLLIRYGANPDIRNNKGQTALDMLNESRNLKFNIPKMKRPHKRFTRILRKNIDIK